MPLLFSASRLLTASLLYSAAQRFVKPRTRIKNLLCMKSNRSRSHPEDRLQATCAALTSTWCMAVLRPPKVPALGHGIIVEIIERQRRRKPQHRDLVTDPFNVTSRRDGQATVFADYD
jgi:hypothetical protein